MRVLPLLLALCAASACSQAATVEEKAADDRSSVPAPTAAATADAKAPAKKFVFSKKLSEPGGGAMDFSYSWPAKVSAEHGLVAVLDEHRAKMLETVSGEWGEVAEDCPADAVSCRNYSYSNDYQVVADLPRFLSLSNMLYTYTGGAHGLYGKDSSIWDREAKELLDPQEFFTSPAALYQSTSKRACAGLDKERMKRRGETLASEPGEWPNNCPAMDETVVFIGSSNGKTFDRLGFYYGPYTAGSYAEGDFEINLPIDAAVLKAVKPEYARYFSVKR